MLTRSRQYYGGTLIRQVYRASEKISNPQQSEFVIDPGQNGIPVFVKSMTWASANFAN
jgi:hypothetical protein